MGTLTGKTAIITGASSGYGQGTAYAFAAEGCNLVVTARREERLKETVRRCKELGAEAVYYAGDAIREQTAINVVKLTVETFGKIDILVNNAGIGKLQSIMDTSMEDYDLIMNSNVRSAFAFSKHVVPEMLKHHDGQIIMVSSVTGTWGHSDESAYTASKFAIRGLGQALDQELCDKGIRTCVFCPHAGVTEFEVGFGRNAKEWEKRRDGLLVPEDVGRALVSVCTQTPNCRVTELQLTGYKCKWY